MPWRVIDTESLVVDVKAGLLYPLNSVGTRIWQLSDGQRSGDEIVGIIAAEFDADLATIREDTTHFLHELAQAKLISMNEKPNPRPADTPGSETVRKG